MAKRVSEFLTESEIKAMLRVPDRRTLKGKRDYAVLLLMLSSGLRKAEVCSLTVASITTYRNQPVFDVTGKGKRQRRVPGRKGGYRGDCGLQEVLQERGRRDARGHLRGETAFLYAGRKRATALSSPSRTRPWTA